MRLQLKLLDSTKDIESKILKALLSEVSDSMKKYAKNISKEIKELVVSALQNSPEYQSLVSGSLQAEFGIPDPENRLVELLNIWARNASVTFATPTITGSRIKGYFRLEMIKADLSDVLGSDLAMVIDSNSGKSLHWLEWLSLAGDKTIIKDYDIVYGPNKRSRTGLAIMRSQSGARWKVPSEFAGNIGDNWITRSIDSISDSIDIAIQSGFNNFI
jgi:hypothetical protein